MSNHLANDVTASLTTGESERRRAAWPLHVSAGGRCRTGDDRKCVWCSVVSGPGRSGQAGQGVMLELTGHHLVSTALSSSMLGYSHVEMADSCYVSYGALQLPRTIWLA